MRILQTTTHSQAYISLSGSGISDRTLSNEYSQMSFIFWV